MMKYVKAVRFLEPISLLGKAVRVRLNGSEKSFSFKVLGCGPGYISGYDGEGMDLKISLDDIDFIVGA